MSRADGDRLRDFEHYPRWFLADSLISVGAAVRSFAIPLIAFEVTRRPDQVGWIIACGQVAALVATIPGGVAKDTIAKSRLLVVSGGLAAVAAAIVALSPLATGGAGIALLVALTLVVGLRAGALINTTDLILPDIVAARALPKAYAANQARDSVLSLVAAPVGGVLMRVWIGLPVIVEAVSAALTAVALRKVSPRPASHRKRGESLFGHAKAGLALVLASRPLKAIAILSVLLVGTLNAATTSSIVAARAMGFSVLEVSLINVAIGLGLLCGSFIVPVLTPKLSGGPALAWCVIGIAVPFFVAAYAVSPLAKLVWLFIAALPFGLANAVASGYLAHIVPDSIRGRVFAVLALFNFAGTAILLTAFGALSQHFSLVGVLVAASAFMLLTVVYVALSPSIRKIPPPREWKQEKPGPSDLAAEPDS